MKGTDVAVIGAGPTGCATALFLARAGARVTVLEANPASAKRLAGEWMHPPGAQVLAELGLRPGVDLQQATVGSGFVVHCDDGEGAITLPYPNDSFGFSMEHAELVSTLRNAMRQVEGIEYLPGARVVSIADGTLTFREAGGRDQQMLVGQVIGADGRSSVARRALGLSKAHEIVSRMAGISLRNVSLPKEGYGHVLVGGPGPVLVYRIGPDAVRMIMDVPQDLYQREGMAGVLWDHYQAAMPRELWSAFREALKNNEIAWCANAVRLRQDYGTEDIALVGDAVGHLHPLTAIGMTMGLRDARAVAQMPFKDYVRQRRRESRVPGLLGVLLYDVFSDHAADTEALRHATYQLWRGNPHECRQTMRYLSTADTSPGHFWRSFGRVVMMAAKGQAEETLRGRGWPALSEFTRSLSSRRQFLATSVARLEPTAARSRMAKPTPVSATPLASSQSNADALERVGTTLRGGLDALARAQLPTGAWEGEVVWCAMLAAQYALVHHLLGRPLPEGRRASILTQLEVTQRPDGTWGQNPTAPSLFVTTLAYVAGRTLGLGPEDPLLQRARDFIQSEGGAARVPTWGKAWLAAAGLYDWEGVAPLRPELWLLPKWLPVHPARLYCHTRIIYMTLAYLYGRRASAASSPWVEALRSELYQEPYNDIPWARYRMEMREEDLYAPPTEFLKAGYGVLGWLEKLPDLRRQTALDAILEQIHFELQSTQYSAISPVSGLLSILCLHHAKSDPQLIDKAFTGLERWIWEDEEEGLRVSGARSATWDTAFTLQALRSLGGESGVGELRQRAERYLEAQQVRVTPMAWGAHDRLDPHGGFTFTESWHTWPVSDCTAEALLALTGDTHGAGLSGARAREAVDFILRCRNRDGGFGSFENQRSFNLEWLNPAEMFGDSMTEKSYIECTGSSLGALATFRRLFPSWSDPRIDNAIADGRQWLLRHQNADGSWSGFWGVNYIYGTMLAVRGLREAGLPAAHPALRRAMAWLLQHQLSDGGWGEKLEGCWEKRFIPHERSGVVQTAWALMTLLAAECPDTGALLRGAQLLADRQLPNGDWSQEEPAGVFFRTAVLDYRMYKTYFPVWALAELRSHLAARPGAQVTPLPETFAAPSEPRQRRAV